MISILESKSSDHSSANERFVSGLQVARSFHQFPFQNLRHVAIAACFLVGVAVTGSSFAASAATLAADVDSYSGSGYSSVDTQSDFYRPIALPFSRKSIFEQALNAADETLSGNERSEPLLDIIWDRLMIAAQLATGRFDARLVADNDDDADTDAGGDDPSITSTHIKNALSFKRHDKKSEQNCEHKKTSAAKEQLAEADRKNRLRLERRMIRKFFAF